MIAHAGLLAFRMGYETPLAETTCTQRFARFLRPCFFKLKSIDELELQVPDRRGVCELANLIFDLNTSLGFVASPPGPAASRRTAFGDVL